MALRMRVLTAALSASVALSATAAFADGELNLYSSRHYDTDERLYSDFEKETGIKINRIEGKADELIERLKAEGENSPADVLLTVDAGRIWRAADAELLAPVESEVLEERIPEALQHPDNLWFGFSTRARLVFYSKERVSEPPQTYADLADPKYQGQVCARSSSNIYMLSLLASRIAKDGEEAAEAWARGLKDNLARDPQGGDTDQLRGIVSGECDIAVANSYYFARALRSEVDGLSGSIDQIGWVFPDQDGDGTHINVSAGAVVKNAPNRENAVKFLEYLASDSAQEYFAAGNDEYPAVEGVGRSASVTKLGDFKADDLNLSALGEYQAAAQDIYNKVGYK
ncbi:Fe(3+) ABC transporter substrate-binding protein [Oricola cellulosilytica]|uniref:Fe(3+) ABC transporter substrate-binding protein n=1 Tax=Oricola cellulosilytica TaxID=1429082 RepID=A0A4R0PBZ2_9HYPH|nr:Fe(3+) ABC transporter substrate-binding protein [Oricola cellulosilytica]TCD14981.1 Fe(3+) ABC transporter substrate-binding protein [Oricola cellulosilytica]